MCRNGRTGCHNPDLCASTATQREIGTGTCRPACPWKSKTQSDLIAGSAAPRRCRFRAQPVRGCGTFRRQFTVEEQNHPPEVIVLVQPPRSASSPIAEHRQPSSSTSVGIVFGGFVDWREDDWIESMKPAGRWPASGCCSSTTAAPDPGRPPRWVGVRSPSCSRWLGSVPWSRSGAPGAAAARLAAQAVPEPRLDRVAPARELSDGVPE